MKHSMNFFLNCCDKKMHSIEYLMQLIIIPFFAQKATRVEEGPVCGLWSS